ncbi:MAG: VTT domain-containing protein [Candidatus Doudnabacteria bacterium]
MMLIKKFWQWVLKNKHLLVFVLAFVVAIVATLYATQTSWFLNVKLWASENQLRFEFWLLVFKVIGIVWPPFPGVVLTLGAVPVLGWIPAFLIDFIGNIIGSVIAFVIAKRYGRTVVAYLVGSNITQYLSRFKFKSDRELEALTFAFIFGGSLAEVASYIAGLSKVKFSNFVLATVISNLVLGLPLFYLFNFAVTGVNFIYGVIPIIIGVIFFWILRERYFEKE